MLTFMLSSVIFLYAHAEIEVDVAWQHFSGARMCKAHSMINAHIYVYKKIKGVNNIHG